MLSRQLTWTWVMLLTLCTAEDTVQYWRRPIPRGHQDGRDAVHALDNQTPIISNVRDNPLTQPREESAGVKVKYYTYDNYYLRDAANDTFHTDSEFLQYDHFGIFNAATATKKGFLHAEDLDCASSRPNALHSYPNNITSPSVIRSNATALAEAGLSEYFDFFAVTVKPLGPAPAYSTITIDAWKVGPGEGKAEIVSGMFMMWSGDGFLPALTTMPSEMWKGWGEGVNWVEIQATSGEGKAWNFCMDNFILVFHEKEKTKG